MTNKDMTSLVLTRTIDEKITIGDDIVIVIISIEGSRVQIGIDAPRDVPIHRKEKLV